MCNVAGTIFWSNLQIWQAPNAVSSCYFYCQSRGLSFWETHRTQIKMSNTTHNGHSQYRSVFSDSEIRTHTFQRTSIRTKLFNASYKFLGVWELLRMILPYRRFKTTHWSHLRYIKPQKGADLINIAAEAWTRIRGECLCGCSAGFTVYTKIIIFWVWILEEQEMTLKLYFMSAFLCLC
jgi:hypothetical protein